MSLALDLVPSAVPPIPSAVRPRLYDVAVGRPEWDDELSSTLLTGAGAVGRSPVAVLRAPSAVPVRLRLTRRGMLALAVVVAGLGAVLVWLAVLSAPAPTGGASGASGGAAGSGGTGAPAGVTVRAGDTLWSIATRVAPQRDPRAEVATLQRLNHLAGAGLVPGQYLRLR